MIKKNFLHFNLFYYKKPYLFYYILFLQILINCSDVLSNNYILTNFTDVLSNNCIDSFSNISLCLQIIFTFASMFLNI